MSSNRQLLVALGLAAAVLVIGFRESSISSREPAIVTAARLRQASPARAAASRASESEVATGDTLDRDARPTGLGEQLSDLPLVQVLALLSGGPGSAVDGEPDALNSPEKDWELLEQADSLLRSPEIRRLAERLVAQGSGGD
jgi:hypothetical protein